MNQRKPGVIETIGGQALLLAEITNRLRTKTNEHNLFTGTLSVITHTGAAAKYATGFLNEAFPNRPTLDPRGTAREIKAALQSELAKEIAIAAIPPAAEIVAGTALHAMGIPSLIRDPKKAAKEYAAMAAEAVYDRLDYR